MSCATSDLRQWRKDFSLMNPLLIKLPSVILLSHQVTAVAKGNANPMRTSPPVLALKTFALISMKSVPVDAVGANLAQELLNFAKSHGKWACSWTLAKGGCINAERKVERARTQKISAHPRMATPPRISRVQDTCFQNNGVTELSKCQLVQLSSLSFLRWR